MEKEMDVLMNKLDMAEKELNDMQQLSNSKALDIQQNWEADSGVSSPVLSLSSQLDNQSPKQSLVLEIQNQSQELQQDMKTVKTELSEEKVKNNNLLVHLRKVKQERAKVHELLRKFEIKKRNWINYYKDLERDYYKGLDFHYKLEDECQKLKKSNIHFKNRAYNNRVTITENNSKELQKQLDIMDDKIKAQELESSKIILQRDALDKTLLKEKQKNSCLGQRPR